MTEVIVRGGGNYDLNAKTLQASLGSPYGKAVTG